MTGVTMFYIPVLLGSVRLGRQSPKVAHYLLSKLNSSKQAQSELLDLKDFGFPIMEERLGHIDSPPEGLEEFSEKVKKADALLIVSPEYNGSYPGVLKNAIDYLKPEFARKAIGLSTVSAGGFGGINCLGHLQHLFLSLGALVVPTNFPVSKVQNTFDDEGKLLDPSVEKRANRFIDDLLWYTEALANQRAKTSTNS